MVARLGRFGTVSVRTSSYPLSRLYATVIINRPLKDKTLCVLLRLLTAETVILCLETSPASYGQTETRRR